MKKSQRRAIEVGAGVLTAAALAAAAGAYLLSGKEGKKRQAKLKAWAKQAQSEVAKRVKMARKLSRADYARIVDQAVKRYGSMADVNAREIVSAGKQMKSEWARIQKHATMMAKEMGAMAKKARKPAKRRKSAKRRA